MTSGQILTGKTAVVTGAPSGIGRAIAEKLGSAGAHVYLAGRTPDAMEASKARIEDNSGKATPVVANVRDVAQVMDLVDRRQRDRAARHHGEQRRRVASKPNHQGGSGGLARDARDEHPRPARRLSGSRPSHEEDWDVRAHR